MERGGGRWGETEHNLNMGGGVEGGKRKCCILYRQVSAEILITIICSMHQCTTLEEHGDWIYGHPHNAPQTHTRAHGSSFTVGNQKHEEHT